MTKIESGGLFGKPAGGKSPGRVRPNWPRICAKLKPFLRAQLGDAGRTRGGSRRGQSSHCKTGPKRKGESQAACHEPEVRFSPNLFGRSGARTPGLG